MYAHEAAFAGVGFYNAFENALEAGIVGLGDKGGDGVVVLHGCDEGAMVGGEPSSEVEGFLAEEGRVAVTISIVPILKDMTYVFRPRNASIIRYGGN